MSEKILTRLNQTIRNYNELLTFRDELPEGLMNSADKTVKEEIPKTLNKMLELLNFLNNEEVFQTENNIEELQEIFQTQQNSLNYLFEKAENNKEVKATNHSETFNTSFILDALKTGYFSHCDTIFLTLDIAKRK